MNSSNISEHPASATRLDYLDGWRGIAIALVLFDHFFHGPTGGAGVDIFFSLSGLLMSGILFVNRVDLGTFYKRRIARIFPVFALYVTFIYIVAWWIGNPEAQNYIYTLTFLRSYLPVSPTIFHTELPIGHLWSLNVEEHSYVLLSLLTFLRASRKTVGWIILLAGVASVLIGVVYHFLPGYQSLYFQLHSEVKASHLLVSAGYYLLAREYGLHLPVKLFLPLCVSLAICYSGLIPGAPMLLSPFLAALVVNHLGDAGRRVHGVLERRWLVSLGLWSFSIYIWQQVFYFSIGRFVPNSLTVQIAGCFLAIFVGAMSYRYYETPLRRRINGLSLRKVGRLATSREAAE